MRPFVVGCSIWGLWHHPALVGKPVVVWVAQFLLTISLRLIFSHFYFRTNGSVVVMSCCTARSTGGRTL